MADTDPGRPSFFELIAAEQLQDLLQPVSRYLLSVLAQRHPRYLLRIFNKHDEVFGFAMLLIERHYLKTWSATFAEHFYSLKRRQKTPQTLDAAATTSSAAAALFQPCHALSRRDIWMSLFIRVGVPYLQSKAQQYYESLGGDLEIGDLFSDEPAAVDEETSDQPPLERLADRAKSIFKTAYPYVHSSYQALVLLYGAAYIFHDAPFFRPWLHLLRIEMRRMSPQESQRWPTPPDGLLPKLQHYGFESLQYVIPASIFFFKFVEWWQTSSLRSSNAALDLAVPPALRAPTIPSLSDTQSPEQSSKKEAEAIKPGQCPVCKESIVNPTAFTVSGAVACYTCAFKWVEREHRCPLTNAPAERSHLRRILG